jgi:hypothetical protein
MYPKKAHLQTESKVIYYTSKVDKHLREVHSEHELLKHMKKIILRSTVTCTQNVGEGPVPS